MPEAGGQFAKKRKALQRAPARADKARRQGAHGMNLVRRLKRSRLFIFRPRALSIQSTLSARGCCERKTQRNRS